MDGEVARAPGLVLNRPLYVPLSCHPVRVLRCPQGIVEPTVLICRTNFRNYDVNLIRHNHMPPINPTGASNALTWSS